MDCQNSENMSNTFGGNNYSNDYSNTMTTNQTYQIGMNNNLYSIDNISNSLSQTTMNNGPGLGMMAELL